MLSTNIDIQPTVCSLTGYLLSLRRLSSNKCDFWADTIDLNGSVLESLESHLKGREITLGDSSVAGYSEVDNMLRERVFSNLTLADENLLKLFAWDIIELIEMAYRLIEPEINPIASGKALLINANSEFHGDYVYLVIPVDAQAILVGVANRA